MIKRPHYDMKETGKRLRQLRLERGFSVEEIREYMQFESVQAIYKWERGESFPQIDNLFALAELFDVDPKILMVKKIDMELICKIIRLVENNDGLIERMFAYYNKCISFSW